MDVILGASIIAAFLAGMVALFAPCCITVLLPAYLASTLRQKQRILPMTFVFFAGIAVVLVPIGMGAAFLAELFRDFHSELYIAGGAFMLVLAVLSAFGKNLPIVPLKSNQLASLTHQKEGMGAKSVFALGILSGAATSCCAPVLAGAVTLAVLSGAFWKALAVTFAYVFGMVIPLLIAAYFYDRLKGERSKFITGKIFTFTLGKKEFAFHSTNLLAAAIFFIMGIVLFVLSAQSNAFWAPSYQIKIGDALNRWSGSVLQTLATIPDALWGAVLVSALLFFAYAARKRNKA